MLITYGFAPLLIKYGPARNQDAGLAYSGQEDTQLDPSFCSAQTMPLSQQSVRNQDANQLSHSSQDTQLDPSSCGAQDDDQLASSSGTGALGLGAEPVAPVAAIRKDTAGSFSYCYTFLFLS